MSGRRVVRWSLVLGLLGLRTLTGAGSEAQPAVTREPRVYISDSMARGVVTRAIAGALRRLDRAECRLVLEDFAGDRGQPLQAILSALDMTPAMYLLERLWFVDGSDDLPCRNANGTRAFTSPGHKVIRICTRRLAARSGSSGVSVELLIIHEMLHTLGLGEDPPSSEAISRQVSRRCRSN